MLIERIREKLKKYPSVLPKVNGSHLEVIPQSDSGFTVWAHEADSSFTVGFEGWHEEFSNPDEALNCFAFGLSNSCRLRIFGRGGKDYKWQVFHQTDGKWMIESETGLLFFPFWRQMETRELQNALIKNA